jgi:hypothetical protein
MGNSQSRGRNLWIVNCISFTLFSLLAVSGLVNAYILPRGFRGGEGFFFSFRHVLVEVHEWTALAFIFIITIHLFLHWSYIRANLKK